jgi:threonylcarbamoyladenosine tRNA methylthiotransferase CDKAL1
MTKKACLIFARGCSRSQIDLVRLHAYFEANSWEITPSPREADMVVVSACAFTAHEQRTSEAYLQLVTGEMPSGSRLVTVGCLAGIAPTVADKFHSIPLKVDRLTELDSLIGATVPLAAVPDQNLVETRLQQAMHSVSRRNRLRATLSDRGEIPLQMLLGLRHWAHLDPKSPEAGWGEPFHIRVARGCASECSYCAIRLGAGPLRSKPLDDIVTEFETGLADGSRLFNLTAEDVGAYGQDIGLSVVDLLKPILGHKGDFRVTWGDFGPRWLIEQRRDLQSLLIAHKDKLGTIGFPIQSGSDRILQLMKRGYTAAESRDCLLALRRAAPDLRIVSHVILGFPGETRRDLLDTCDLVRSIGFARVQPFTYSVRPGTEAAELPGQLSSFVKAMRTWEFRARLRLPGVHSLVQ